MIELLVIISIIGMLIAILLPAVQYAREAARRVHCQNNLKQIGIAFHNYHSSWETFPTGGYGYRSGVNDTPDQADLSSPRADGRPIGKEFAWNVYLLPFLEQTGVAAKLNKDLWIDHPANRDAVRTVLPVFLCPSAGDPRATPANIARNVTRTMTTPFMTYPGLTAAEPFRCGRSHYAGVQSETLMAPFGETRPEDKAGTRTDQKKGMLLALPGENPLYRGIRHCTDGTSNTLILTEDSDHYDSAWPSLRNLFVQMNGMSKYVNTRSCTGATDPNGHRGKSAINEPCARGTEGYNNTFSYHPGGVVILKVDGSTHFIPENINYLVYAYLICRADGQTIELP